MNLKEHLIVYVDDERTNRIVFEQSFGAPKITKDGVFFWRLCALCLFVRSSVQCVFIEKV